MSLAAVQRVRGEETHDDGLVGGAVTGLVFICQAG